jgi:hypothetical protein
MDRVLSLRLESVGCAAEAVLIGFSLGRTPKGGGVLTLSVHEYTVSGDNQLALVVEPHPLQRGSEPAQPQLHLGDAKSMASLRLLLTNVGRPSTAQQAHVLAQLEWLSPSGEMIQLPHTVEHLVNLPINFARWRWIDLPVLPDPEAVRQQIVELLQGIALSLSKGQAEGFILAAKLRFEELALAYQRDLPSELALFRAEIQRAHAEEPLRVELPTAQMQLRRCVDGRLIECLGPDGQPALRTTRASGLMRLWPVRIAILDERAYVLR